MEYRFAAPQLRQQFESFVEHRAAGLQVGFLAQVVPLPLAGADTDAEDHPPVGQVIQ